RSIMSPVRVFSRRASASTRPGIINKVVSMKREKGGCMRNKPVAACLLVLSCVLCARGQVRADDQQERMLAVFHPYRQGIPQVEGIRPGMTIDKTNYQVAGAVLPPEILRYLQAGDFTITVQETTDMPLR